MSLYKKNLNLACPRDKEDQRVGTLEFWKHLWKEEGRL
jgi:hypothetical protein